MAELRQGSQEKVETEVASGLLVIQTACSALGMKKNKKTLIANS